MNINFFNTNIEINKELDKLDFFVLDFCSLLNKLNIKHVIISGYVSILFGRSRLSEDIDIFIEEVDYFNFQKLWKEVMISFDCINAQNSNEAYYSYLLKKTSIRFSRKNEFIPNIELKFPKNELDIWTLENKRKIIFNKNILYISSLELQIPFKLLLGSDKDIEDARYLYSITKKHLNLSLFNRFIKELGVEKAFNKYLK